MYDKYQNLMLSILQRVGQITCSTTSVVKGNAKVDKTKILKTNGSVMKVESIAECSLGAFSNTFDLH